MDLRIKLQVDIEMSEEQESWSIADLEQWAIDFLKNKPEFEMFDVEVEEIKR